ncbi:SusC/RagA family TonB-linked outer membrane protein [Anditalea andensis]|uniref:TonB-dependent receptor n=1 Tax=Anditalea andensis TaxID=1048983 RepID=A0A074KZQ9_9BACT|nr:SusC/RagA family TonB-linked outer membrane protein [Anditalea andensis]KEO75481.1 hypothetical protein EL17_01125 [Anditalea andensis]
MEKKLLKFIGFALCYCIPISLIAQSRVIEGTVYSREDISPIPGVSVYVKGNVTQDTMTDLDGNFSISANSNETVVFSFIGMKTQEKQVANTAEWEIFMDMNDDLLQEVVVTAFGIEQERRSLGYSVQEIKSERILETQQPNIINTLQGKVAGVQITNSGGAPGASAIMMIRGGTSLSGNNQPLYVVDGIPIDNTTPVGQGGLGAATAPASNRAIDINPNDIASISVLKGPAAAALYGLRASEGVVVITTKKGQAGVARVNYGNSFSFDKVNKLPELQSRYKQGEFGVFDPEAIGSWGPVFAAEDIVYDNLGSIFEPAFSQRHDVSVSGGNDRSTFYASASRLDQGGIVPNTEFKRNSFRLTGDTRAGDKLRIGGSFNYVQTDRNYVSQGSANGIMGAVYWPRNDDMRNYLNVDGTHRTIGVNDNPFWGAYNKPNASEVERIIGTGNIIYDPFPFLNITYRFGTDYYTDNFTGIRMPGTTIVSEEQGAISESTTNNQISTSTLLVTLKKEVNDFSASLTLGHNAEDFRRQTTTWYGRNFIDPGFAGINNVVEMDRTISQNINQRRIIGVFGDLNLDWKNIIFLNIRGRNDWSSTLPVAARSFFYPSVSTSISVSDLLHEIGWATGERGVSFGKIRASWARVGKDAPPHVLATTLATATNTFTIAPRGFISNANDYYGNPSLRPEFTNSIELGTDVRFFQNKLGVDITYYKTSTDEQILGTRTPPSSGAFLAYLNGGQIDNEGVELMINTRPLSRGDFSWTMDFNFAKNVATVRGLPGTLDRVELSDAWVAGNVAQGAAFLGGSLFGINGTVWRKNADGVLLLNNDGYPQVQSTLTNIGDRNPDWTGGITNTLSYKTLSLSFMWDIRIGGHIYNATENTLVRSGLSTKTTERGNTRVFEGIIESTGEPNTQAVVLNQDYYQSIYPFQGFDFVEDGGWWRLRYVTLAYNFPLHITERLKFQNLQVFGTGRNLLLFTSYSGVDPEVSGSGAGVGGSGSFGFDNLGVPATKGFDLGIKLTF